MSTPLDTPIVCPILLGRSAPMAVLSALISQVQAGQGQVVLLSGEAGIGKSRLVAEVKAQAIDCGFDLIEGRCFESDHATPYAPLLDLFRTYLATHPPTIAGTALGPLAADLLPLLPEIRVVLADRPPASERQPTGGPSQLMRAFTQFVAAMAASRPVLVVVEDLHWSDDASSDALLALIRRGLRQPMLLILTYRRDEVSPSLAHMLAELDRQRTATEMALLPLTRDEIDGMLRAIFNLAGPARADFLDAITALTDIIYIDGAWDRKPLQALQIPRSVQAAVQRRLDQLSPAARELITLAAVAGRRFEFTLIERLTHHGEAALIRLVKELVRAQLVVEESPEIFAFRHALTRQAKDWPRVLAYAGRAGQLVR